MWALSSSRKTGRPDFIEWTSSRSSNLMDEINPNTEALISST